MAEGFLRHLDPTLDVQSAGTHPAFSVHPLAINVMKEKGIDISLAQPKDVYLFLGETFDFIITVCDHARETCPVFAGRVKQRLHIGFDDPVMAYGTEEHILGEFRRVRDEIERAFRDFHSRYISTQQSNTR